VISGHWPRRSSPHPQLKDLAGQRFGIVTVLARAPNQSNGSAAWRVKCDCGAERIITGVQLRATPPKTHRRCKLPPAPADSR
jgi:hypothetical protein